MSCSLIIYYITDKVRHTKYYFKKLKKKKIKKKIKK